MPLKDKVILITGGAGLLGTEFSRAVSQAGGTVIIADHDFERAQKIAASVLNSVPISMDITSKDSIDSAITLVEDQFGKIDALVNNAYPRNNNYGKSFLEVEYDDFCTNLGMNLGGYFLTSQRFIHFFLRQGHGNIVNISSIYGVTAPRFDIYEGTSMTMPVEYAAIKSGLIHLTKYMTKFTKGRNIRVNALSPGGIKDSQPSIFIDRYKEHCLNKGMLSPSDITGSLIFLLSDFSQYVNGQNIVVDDGFTL